VTMRNHVNEISKLLYAYTHRFDAGDLEGAAELFKYARLITGPDGESVNSAEMLKIWQAMVIIHEETGTPRTKHSCTNAIIDVDEAKKSATARSYYVVHQQTKTLPLQAIVAGRYEDKFELVNDVWRFSERDYRLIEMTGDMSEHIRDPELLAIDRGKTV